MKTFLICAVAMTAGLWPLTTVASAAEKIEFNRDVRPILAENCLPCHGPDSAARKADLRLDRREAAVASKTIVPGKPDDSELVRRIFSAEDDDEVMPPPASHKKLTAPQKDLLKRWVAAGAEYEPHWSFIAPQRPRAAGGEERGLGPQSDRSIHPGEAGGGVAWNRPRKPTAARWPGG